VTKAKQKDASSDVIGKCFAGTVKKIVEFGVFVGIEGFCDALLHKSNIPRKLRDDLNGVFKRGDGIKVEVTAITEKGMQLKYVSEAEA
jgi:ribosomal protein S1